MTDHAEEGRLRIVGADVVTMAAAGTLFDHDITIGPQGTIESILPSEGPQSDDERTIDARDFIVAPGFIDVHRHLWVTSFRGFTADLTAQGYRQLTKSILAPHIEPQDVYAATRLGAAESLDAGITTVVDYAHIMKSPEHADASLAALEHSGGRAVLAHAPPNGSDNAAWWSESDRRHPADLRRVVDRAQSAGGLVTVMMGARGGHFLAPGTIQRDVAFARDLGVRMMFEGLGGAIGGSGRWSRRTHRTADALARSGLLGPDMVFVHGNHLPDSEFAHIARHGAHLAIAPLTEMLCGYGLPALDRAVAAGIRPGLAVDIVTSAPGDMFGAMRSALAVSRGTLTSDAYLTGGGDVAEWPLVCNDMLTFATLAGARVLGLEGSIGSIAVGKTADLIMVSKSAVNLFPISDPVTSLVLFAHPGNIDSVLVGGKVVKRHGVLTMNDLDDVRQMVSASRSHLLRAAGEPENLDRADAIWKF